MTYIGERQVRLFSGELVSNYSEEWRIETEARDRLRRPFEKRNDMLETVEKKRGIEGRIQLEQAMRALEPAHVLGLPNKDVRRLYLSKVERQYGVLYRERLETETLALYERRKAEALAACNGAAA